jgi:hypothetical protein
VKCHFEHILFEVAPVIFGIWLLNHRGSWFEWFMYGSWKVGQQTSAVKARCLNYSDDGRTAAIKQPPHRLPRYRVVHHFFLAFRPKSC